jgi:drug/metabolite transporter (DMT)-like permease
MMKTYLLLIMFPFAMATGQMLFKHSASRYDALSSPLLLFLKWPFLLALVVYAITTVGWVLVLRTVALSKAYPFMALSFVLVPFLSWIFFKEQISPRYLLGIGSIVFGIVLTVR